MRAAFAARTLAGLLVLIPAIGAARADAAGDCTALRGIQIAAERIGLPTSGAVIDAADLVAADAKDNINGEFCKVLGSIKPVDATAPDIKFQVNLPSAWNGKLLHLGGAGYNGVLVTGLLNTRFFKPGTETPLKRGYVTFGSDSGHQSSPIDGRFGLNAEALKNFGGDQLKKTHDVAQELVAKRYGRKPDRVYFFGNSQGGHEGFIVIQRWPQYYDGVVAIHPVYNFAALQIDGNARARALYGGFGYDSESGWLNPAKLKLMQSSVMAACDKLDGVEDGIISNVAACRTAFRLADLRCEGGKDTGDGCLSDRQIKAVEVIDSTVEFGFAVQAGLSSFPRWPILEGGDWAGLFGFGASPKPANPPLPGKNFGLAVLSDPLIRYMVLRGAPDDLMQFDPKAHAARLREVSETIDANRVDIDAFKARGGKLLLMHGTVDTAVAPANTVAYYQRLVKQFGQGDLDSFVRFYLAPGFGHGTGQFVVGWDPLSTLELWVEKGAPPGPQVVVDTKEGNRSRTRPLCVYPTWPKFTGGNADDAASFSCVNE
jgi:feruloyl esterase